MFVAVTQVIFAKLADSVDLPVDSAPRKQTFLTLKSRATNASRFHLESGQALLVDNYRMFHGREGYADPQRMMWRVWGWSDDTLGVPEVPLHSDTRYAHSN